MTDPNAAPRRTKAPTPSPVAHPSITSIELRRMAEHASSVRGDDLFFVQGPNGWTAATSLIGLPPGTPQIHVRNARVHHQPVAREATIGAGGEPVNLFAIKMPEDRGGGFVEADAVFWSASAVEKFLVPYYASVYGNKAADVVRKLLNVLEPRGTGTSGAGAFAIAHIPRSEYVDIDSSSGVLAQTPDRTTIAMTLDQHAEWVQRGNSGATSGSRRT